METLLATSLHSLSESYNKALNSARKEFEASTGIHEFLKYEDNFSKKGDSEPEEPKNLARLFKVSVYGQAECFKKLGVGTRAEMEKLWGEHLANPDVKEAVDALQNAENSSLKFIDEVDQKLAIEEGKFSGGPSHAGMQLPKELSVIDASSGHPTALESICKTSKYTLFMYVRHFG